MKPSKNIIIIGGGPSGLMAAETLAQRGFAVAVYDRMPSVGRKFQMAGRGGLNLTHSEPLEKFISRYGDKAEWMAKCIHDFTPTDLRNWCEGLGEPTFVGSSGRVFPKSMKAAPLLRAWLRRLDSLGVKFYLQHNWLGFEGDALKLANKDGEVLVEADAILLALGGASWAKLGSNGKWVEILQARGVDITELKPTNSGFTVNWSDFIKEKFAGTPLKPVAINFGGISQRGEVMITRNGIEGGAIYAISAALREEIIRKGKAEIFLDLRPDMSAEQLNAKLNKPKGKESLSNILRKSGFSPLAVALLHEVGLGHSLKALPITLIGVTGIERAISSAGGVRIDAIDENFMLKSCPNVFVSGEMLDWEAPTGGYLLQGCLSTAIAAARGIIKAL